MGETGALHGYEKILFGALISILALFNVVGNGLVVITVIRSPLLRTPMHYLLANLCFAYILAAVFFIPRYVINDIIEYPDDPTVANLLCMFLMAHNLSWISLRASVFTLVIIAFERYFVILHPRIALGRFTKATLVKVLVACWSIAILLAIPEFIYLAYNKEKHRCMPDWSENVREVNASILIFSCGLLPILIMGFLYGRILRNIHISWKRETAVSRRALLRSRRKLTKTVLLLASIYAVFWIPNLVVWAVGPGFQAYGVLLASSHVCLLISACAIPCVYIIQDEHFRMCLQHMCTRHTRNQVEDCPPVNFSAENPKSVGKKVRFTTPFVLVPRLEMEQCSHG